MNLGKLLSVILILSSIFLSLFFLEKQYENSNLKSLNIEQPQSFLEDFSSQISIPTKSVQTPANLLARLPEYNLDSINNQVKAILGSEQSKYAISVSLPNQDFKYGFAADQVFYSASISKIPIALLILRDIDAGKYSLKRTLAIEDDNKAYETDSLYYYDAGTYLTMDTYLNFMITQSDNTAMLTLENYLGGYQVVNSRAKSELGLNTLSREPMQATAVDVDKAFTGIYKQTYLSKSSNDYLLDLLIHIATRSNDRIPAGVPTGVKVAHKIGQIDSDNGQVYQDAGIVFGPNADFVIVVLNKDTDQKTAVSKITQLTKYFYGIFES